MGKKKGKVGKWGEKIEKPPEKRGEMGKCGAAGRKYGKTQRNLWGKGWVVHGFITVAVGHEDFIL